MFRGTCEFSAEPDAGFKPLSLPDSRWFVRGFLNNLLNPKVGHLLTLRSCRKSSPLARTSRGTGGHPRARNLSRSDYANRDLERVLSNLSHYAHGQAYRADQPARRRRAFLIRRWRSTDFWNLVTDRSLSTT